MSLEKIEQDLQIIKNHLIKIVIRLDALEEKATDRYHTPQIQGITNELKSINTMLANVLWPD